MKANAVPAYLVNTGWVGASASSGAKRISLPLTRQIIGAILDGSIESGNFVRDPYFGTEIPTNLGEIESNLLIPAQAWNDSKEYHRTAEELVKKFKKNFRQYAENSSLESAGPQLRPTKGR